MIPPFIQYFVCCIDDNGKPDGIGDWPKKGKVYQVLDVIKNSKMDGSYGYVIKGLNPRGRWETYRADRFIEAYNVNLN